MATLISTRPRRDTSRQSHLQTKALQLIAIRVNPLLVPKEENSNGAAKMTNQAVRVARAVANQLGIKTLRRMKKKEKRLNMKRTSFHRYIATMEVRGSVWV